MWWVGTSSTNQKSESPAKWAAGRTGNTQDLGLDVVGLEANSRGQLDVDENYKTAADHIYAVGDVVGWPSLASAAYDQGRSAAAHSNASALMRLPD